MAIGQAASNDVGGIEPGGEDVMSYYGSDTPPSLLDNALRLSLIAGLLVACLWVLAPFLTLLLWAALLAVMIWPLHDWLRHRPGMTNARSATVIGLASVAVLSVPLVLLLSELAAVAERLLAIVQSGKALPPAPDWVSSLPLAGPKIVAWWDASRGNLGELLAQNGGALKAVAGRIAGGVAGFMVTMLALALAALFLAYGEEASSTARAICVRVTGEEQRGGRILSLITMTIRGVLQGVVGVAFVQAALIGAGFLFVGVPYSGLLILVLLVMGVAQLPALLLTIPVIVWAWSNLDSTSAGIFTGYTLLTGFSDQVLKPIMLGRGVDVPMPIILVGVLGGMLSGGLLGLFIGPVLLAVGYVLFVEWLEARHN